jgi:hypothetical protein
VRRPRPEGFYATGQWLHNVAADITWDIHHAIGDGDLVTVYSGHDGNGAGSRYAQTLVARGHAAMLAPATHSSAIVGAQRSSASAGRRVSVELKGQAVCQHVDPRESPVE